MVLSEAEVEDLITNAIQARERSYSPYSGFKVGAALLLYDGTIILGCNIESISFTPTVCAERAAIFSAISQGSRKFKAMAIVTGDDDVSSPCGVCRQVLAEFVSQDFPIILGNLSNQRLPLTLKDLLPYPFTPTKKIGDV